MNRKVQTIITDSDGFVKEFKVEDVEWNPPLNKYKHNSNSTIALHNLMVGETKRIIHPELQCRIKTYSATKNGSKNGSGRVCSLQPIIYKLRKAGWGLEYYHEKDHVIVIRRLK